MPMTIRVDRCILLYSLHVFRLPYNLSNAIFEGEEATAGDGSPLSIGFRLPESLFEDGEYPTGELSFSVSSK